MILDLITRLPDGCITAGIGAILTGLGWLGWGHGRRT